MSARVSSSRSRGEASAGLPSGAPGSTPVPGPAAVGPTGAPRRPGRDAGRSDMAIPAAYDRGVSVQAIADQHTDQPPADPAGTTDANDTTGAVGTKGVKRTSSTTGRIHIPDNIRRRLEPIPG